MARTTTRRTRRRNPPGWTTAVGLGYAHQQERKRAVAEFTDGDLCWRCGRPMRSWQALDLDHLRPRALGGAGTAAVLAHAHCNRAAGARLQQAMRARGLGRAVRAPRRPRSRW